MELHFKSFGEGPPLVILHGLFGTLDNWQTLGRQLATDHTVYLPDLRNHGRSPHHPVHTYPAMAEDLREFLEQQGIFGAIRLVGHSMGGKVAMQFALDYPDQVERLVVVDIAPKAYEGGHFEIFEALREMRPEMLEDREEADAFLAARIPEAGVRQFLMKNLTRRVEGGFEYKMNLPVLWEHYPKIQEFLQGHPYTGPVLFIRGSLSNYILSEDAGLIWALFPNAHIETVEGAGHWVHADQPAALLVLLQNFLK